MTINPMHVLAAMPGPIIVFLLTWLAMSLTKGRRRASAHVLSDTLPDIHDLTAQNQQEDDYDFRPSPAYERPYYFTSGSAATFCLPYIVTSGSAANAAATQAVENKPQVVDDSELKAKIAEYNNLIATVRRQHQVTSCRYCGQRYKEADESECSHCGAPLPDKIDAPPWREVYA